MAVVGEGLAEAEAAHDGERHVVDNSRVTPVPSVISGPGHGTIIGSWFDDAVVRSQGFAPNSYRRTIHTAGGCVTAFEQNIDRCNDVGSRSFQIVISLLCYGVPLIRLVPQRDHTNRV